MNIWIGNIKSPSLDCVVWVKLTFPEVYSLNFFQINRATEDPCILEIFRALILNFSGLVDIDDSILREVIIRKTIIIQSK
jgi:hypothetical protein